MDLPQYEVYALRYATVERQPRENFITPDPHDGPTTMDYFVWAIVGASETIVVDTGFNAQAADRRKRTLLRCPSEALRSMRPVCTTS